MTLVHYITSHHFTLCLVHFISFYFVFYCVGSVLGLQVEPLGQVEVVDENTSLQRNNYGVSALLNVEDKPVAALMWAVYDKSTKGPLEQNKQTNKQTKQKPAKKK